ncbi:MAG: HAD family hydrolase [Pseudomonadota bacterium]|nr:HAD family hydrolase [Pseudomonadota bacterium]
MVNRAETPSVFLDRDGVIVKTHIRNNKPFAVNKVDDLVILPGVKEAIERLKKLNFLVIVVTNQPDISKGLININTLDQMHEILMSELAIDDIKFCPHLPENNCSCRKPKPGMLLKASSEHLIDLKNSYMIGDRISDIEAGNNAGCKTIFIDYKYAETKGEKIGTDMIVKSLPHAADLINKL